MKLARTIDLLTALIVILGIFTSPSLSLNALPAGQNSIQAPVSQAPTLSMTIIPFQPEVNQTIEFHAQASGGIPPYNFTWTFGDGTAQANGQDMNHVYSSAGTYIVQLHGSDSNSQNATIVQQVTVDSPQPPPVGLKADFTFQPASPVAGDLITFMAAIDGGTAPYVLVWAYGDGTAAVTVSSSSTSTISSYTYTTSHSYISAGQYTVSLTVSDSMKTTVQASHVITVNPPSTPVKPLTADFNPVPQTTTVGHSMTFSAQATGGTAPYSYSWNLGDGASNTGVGQTIVHLYNLPGNYTVTLTVTDSFGLPTTVSHQVRITQVLIPLTVSVSTNPNVGQAGHNVIVRAIISGGISPYTVHWDFGDGQVDNGTIPIVLHEYTAAGTYNLTVRVTDSHNTTGSATKHVRVTIAPPISQPSSQSSSTGNSGQSIPGDLLTGTNTMIILAILASAGAVAVIFLKTRIFGKRATLKRR